MILDIQSVDIKTAYLYGDLDEEICKGDWCKRTPPFLPLNGMTTLQSYLSLFTSDT